MLGWIVLLGLGALVATSLLGISGRAGLALAHDALVYLLALAWVVLVIALLGRSWVLAGGAALLVVYQLVLVTSRLTAARAPRWVRGAPRLSLLVANVFIDNETPDALAGVLLAAGADVIVIPEWNAAFVSAFDAAGGRDGYPERVFDPADASDYAVGIVSKLPLLPESQVITVGPLKLTQAMVEVGGQAVTILGLNPTAAVDPGGFEEWEKQLDALIGYVPSVAGRLVVAGDLNTTRTVRRCRNSRTGADRRARIARQGPVDVVQTVGRRSASGTGSGGAPRSRTAERRCASDRRRGPVERGE